MRCVRIIACTTTAAAKYSDIIRRVSPGVVLVEEAGEILESHVLTALGPKTKHLILIGDHKQLRPKVNYELSVEKGTGFDLNRSLFERLILKGFPYQTLYSQHRMRPEISALVREMTYPELKDAEQTQERPDLRGFTDNIIFVNHKELKSEFSGARELGDSKASATKQNRFEAKMTLKCVRYLAQQGYGTDDIVVLTPYLGQLRLLHDELKVDNDPVLNDLDSHDLVRAGLMPKRTAQDKKLRLRISTIDNFQGEEANIVVASLCRSNINNDIGFMFAPERLNVLISRARDAIILIGNAEHFTGSRKGGDLWKRFIGLLKVGMHVYSGFPVRCERHPDRTAILEKPTDFDTECPNGGCKKPCGEMLNCGDHMCPNRCHLLVDHSKVKCNAVVSSECDKGHVYSAKCHAKKVCTVCEMEAKKAQEEAERKVRALEKEREHFLQMAELDKEIEAIMAAAKAGSFAGNDPNQTLMQVTQLLDRVNIQYLHATSIVQKAGSPVMEAPSEEQVTDSARMKTSDPSSDPSAAQMDHKEQAPKEFRLQEEELMRTQREFEIVEQHIKELKERSSSETEEKSRLEQELELARIRAIALKRKMVALLRPRFEPTKSQLLKQQLKEVDESSPAKAGRARIRAVKHKQARDAKEHCINVSREAQPWRHKEVPTFSQRRFKTAQTQVRSRQKWGDAEEESHAKAKRASGQALKLKRAQDANCVSAPRERQLRRPKEVPAHLQWRFKTAQTQVRSERELGASADSSQVKVGKARSYAMKLKYAPIDKERSTNVLQEAQLRKCKEEEQAEKKLSNFGTNVIQVQQNGQPSD